MVLAGGAVGLLTALVALLAEARGDAAPALVSVVTRRTLLHARVLVQVVPARHTLVWQARLQAPP